MTYHLAGYTFPFLFPSETDLDPISVLLFRLCPAPLSENTRLDGYPETLLPTVWFTMPSLCSSDVLGITTLFSVNIISLSAASLSSLMYGGEFDLWSGWTLSNQIAQLKCLQMVSDMKLMQGLNQIPRDHGRGHRTVETSSDNLQHSARRTPIVLSWTLVDCLELGVTTHQDQLFFLGQDVSDSQAASLARKPTGWMINCPKFLNELGVILQNKKIHSWSPSSFHVRWQLSAPKLLTAILSGMRCREQEACGSSHRWISVTRTSLAESWPETR